MQWFIQVKNIQKGCFSVERSDAKCKMVGTCITICNKLLRFQRISKFKIYKINWKKKLSMEKRKVSLTSSVFITEIRKPPDISQTYGKSNTGQEKVHFGGPCFSLVKHLSIIINFQGVLGLSLYRFVVRRHFCWIGVCKIAHRTVYRSLVYTPGLIRLWSGLGCLLGTYVSSAWVIFRRDKPYL